MMRSNLIVLAMLGLVAVPVIMKVSNSSMIGTSVAVTTYHNDNTRQGLNAKETTLTLDNINSRHRCRNRHAIRRHQGETTKQDIRAAVTCPRCIHRCRKVRRSDRDRGHCARERGWFGGRANRVRWLAK